MTSLSKRTKSILTFLGMALMVSGCNEKTYKNFDYAPVETSFSGGRVKVWTLGTNESVDKNTIIIASPYKLIVEIKIYNQPEGCAVSIDTAQLLSSEGKKIDIITSPMAKAFEPDNSRSMAARLFDRNDWLTAKFSFSPLKLNYEDYILSASFALNGACLESKGHQFELPLKKHYYETTDSFWSQ